MTQLDRSDELAEWYAEDNPDGAALLDSLREFLARFVAYPSPHALIAHVLWICALLVHGFLGIDATDRVPFTRAGFREVPRARGH